MRTLKYDEQEKGSGNTETHVATDLAMKKKQGNMQRALEEEFAASDGVRGVTSTSGGRVKHPDKSDAPLPDPVPDSIENENLGLADN